MGVESGQVELERRGFKPFGSGPTVEETGLGVFRLAERREGWADGRGSSGFISRQDLIQLSVEDGGVESRMGYRVVGQEESRRGPIDRGRRGE